MDDAIEAPTEPTEPEDRISPDQLCGYLARASFATTLGRKGYHQGEVDAFLRTRLTEAVQAGEPLAELVRRHRFTVVRAQDGYEPGQVDDFLAAAVDLDPHADAGRPAVARSGLLTRLFG